MAYLIGFLQSDGHISSEARNRGRMQIEINARDSSVLTQLQSIIPVSSSISYRTRKTNFSEEIKLACLNVFDMNFRKLLVESGVPVGKKSDIIGIPSVPISEPDYFRGLIDGDGSLGFTAAGFPFLSFVTSSRLLIDGYIGYIKSITGTSRSVNRNSRDGIFNLALYKEHAQVVSEKLYGHGGISIRRKQEKFDLIMKWVRPTSMRKILAKANWNDKEDEVVVQNSPVIAANLLNRSISSVLNRRFRLGVNRRKLYASVS